MVAVTAWPAPAFLPETFMKRRHFNVRCAATCAAPGLWSLGRPARAEGFPSKPITLVVPNAPGGAVDILARLLEQRLREAWGQPVNVVYKPGAGTVLGTDFVAKARPADGHVLGFVVTSHVINPSLRKSLPFDTLKDLAGVSLVATAPVLVAATPALEAGNLKELIALAKSRPGRLTYASPGIGSSMHMAGEMLKALAGIDMLHVPFNGSGPAYAEVFAGRVDLLIDPLFSSLPHLKAGRMKPLAVISPQRAPALPEVPAGVETVPGFVAQSIFGLVVPAGTPRDAVNRINADVVTALQAPDVRARMGEIGLAPLGSSAAEFDDFVRREIDKWAKVVKASGAQAE
jgi:tripartite-type tricarboxylate transporter receptor subunit TctC